MSKGPKLSYYPSGNEAWHFNCVGEFADDYGDGNDDGSWYEGGSWSDGEEVSRFNLYTESGKLTKYRIIRGSIYAIRKRNNGSLRFLQDSVNDRYFRRVEKALKNADEKMKASGILATIPDFGELYSVLLRSITKREKYYRGRENYWPYWEKNDQFYRCNPRAPENEYYYYIKDGWLYYFEKDTFPETRKSAINNLLNEYTKSAKLPFHADSYDMKKRFGMKRMPPNGQAKYDRMESKLNDEYYSSKWGASL